MRGIFLKLNAFTSIVVHCGQLVLITTLIILSHFVEKMFLVFMCLGICKFLRLKKT